MDKDVEVSNNSLSYDDLMKSDLFFKYRYYILAVMFMICFGFLFFKVKNDFSYIYHLLEFIIAFGIVIICFISETLERKKLYKITDENKRRDEILKYSSSQALFAIVWGCLGAINPFNIPLYIIGEIYDNYIVNGIYYIDKVILIVIGFYLSVKYIKDIRAGKCTNLSILTFIGLLVVFIPVIFLIYAV